MQALKEKYQFTGYGMQKQARGRPNSTMGSSRNDGFQMTTTSLGNSIRMPVEETKV